MDRNYFIDIDASMFSHSLQVRSEFSAIRHGNLMGIRAYCSTRVISNHRFFNQSSHLITDIGVVQSRDVIFDQQGSVGRNGLDDRIDQARTFDLVLQRVNPGIDRVIDRIAKLD